MLKRFLQAMTAATRAFRASLLPQPIRLPPPVWDDGIDYDVPTFLRRRLG
jgi:hypothetical protein